MSVAVLESLPASFAAQIQTASDMVRERSHVRRVDGSSVGDAEIDRLLAGGLRRGEATEVVGGRSSGRFSLVLQSLAARTSCGETAALIDLGDSLDPRSAERFGVDLRRVLWVRPRTVSEALASAEAILQTAMPLIVVDLGNGPLPGGKGRVSEAAWRRLIRGAAEHGVTLLISSPYRVTGASAQTVLEAERGRGCWSGEGGGTLRPTLLRGIDARLRLVRDRENRHEEPARLDLHVESVRALDPILVDTKPRCDAPAQKESPRDAASVVPFPARPARRGRDTRRGRRYTALLRESQHNTEGS